MSELILRILIVVVALVFVSVSFILTKPVSDGGRLTRKLCITNAVGWLFIAPLSSTGHPPEFLLPTILFWLVNLVMLPAALAALWAGHKERVEAYSFLAVSYSYIIFNLIILFVVPLVLVLLETSR